MRITIVTPSFNQAGYLEEAIDSVLSQGYEDLEYFVVDGGSDDGSAEIIRKHERYISWWVSERDEGQTHAILKGMSRMTGDVFNWINSDDMLCSGSLRAVDSHFQDPGVRCLCSPIEMFNGETTWRHPPAFAKEDSLKTAFGRDSHNQPGTYFRRSAIQEFGLPDIRLDYVMDKEWFIRFLLRFGIEGIKTTDTPLARYRIHEETKTAKHASAFTEEYAQLVYRFCAFGGAPDLAALVGEQYAVQSSDYTVPSGVAPPTRDLLEQLVATLLVRNCFELGSKERFSHVKQVLALIDWSEVALDPACQARKEAVQNEMGRHSWFSYRVKKKIQRCLGHA